MTSPATLNAMDEAMAEAFVQARLQLLEAPPRAVVIAGQGRAFSAGGDLTMLRAKAQLDHQTNRQRMMLFYGSFLDLRDLNVPLLCAIHGHAVGAGFCFAAACDLRVADSTAQFAAPFTRLGLCPGMGGSYFLPRSLGSETARDLMLTGRRMGAQEARQLGFLSAVVPEGSLEEAVQQTLDGVLLGGPEATRDLVCQQREAERTVLHAALQREADAQARCYGRAEFLEGIDALAQKRAPNWR
jgi:enoyl-CoA hydratase